MTTTKNIIISNGLTTSYGNGKLISGMVEWL